jgi:hypothetical protein
VGSKYSSQSTSGYASASPPDDGTQVAANLITWSGVRTKLTDVLKTFGEAINTALVSTLDLSARAISVNDTAIASDHWKTLQVTGATTITLSSAASMGAGYEVGIFNAGASTVTVAPGVPADTINNVSASVTIPIKGTMIFRTNQALTGYNVVGQSNRIDAGTINGATIGATTPSSGVFTTLTVGTGTAGLGTITKRKTADESVTSSAVLQDDDHLTFAIAANEEWIFTLVGGVSQAGTAAGFKAALTFPAGSTLGFRGVLLDEASTYVLSVTSNQVASGNNAVAATSSISTVQQFSISGWVLNGATPGNVTLQWAQGTSSGFTTTVKKGAFLQATRIV